MEPIVKVLSCLMGVFMVVNGIRIIMTPPYGDEPQGYIIVVVGILMPIVMLYIGRDRHTYD